jgi:hypothetical protein
LQYTAARFEDQAGARIFDADLVDLRLTWQFSVRSLLRLTLQQQLIERNLALFTSTNVDARSKTRGTELLYSYRLNPQTVVYAGYSDSYAQYDEFTSLTEMDRTFFLKLSYAWAP